jgi:hypothetical protein
MGPARAFFPSIPHYEKRSWFDLDSVSPIVGQLNLDIAIFSNCTLFIFTNIYN